MGCSVRVRVQRLEYIEAGHPHLPNLVIEHPANVLEVGVRQELDTAWVKKENESKKETSFYM